MGGNATLSLLNKTMHAVLWSGIPFNVAIVDVPISTIQNPADAWVRMTTAGICGGDLHVYHGSFGSSTLPWVLGQEGTSIVESIGSGVQHLRAGDHVVIPDTFNIEEINMGIVEPEVQLGTSLGLGLDYGNFKGCQCK